MTAKVPVSVRLVPALARQLRAAAIQRGVSVTSLVEQACEKADWAAAVIPEGIELSCAVDHGGRPCPGYHGGGQAEPRADRCPVHPREPLRSGACQVCDGGLF